jgi:membrane protein
MRPKQVVSMTESNLKTEEQISTLWDLGGLTRRELLKKVIRATNEQDLFGRASELAYNFILAIFPLLLFMLSLLGLFASRGRVLRTNLLTHFSQVLPPQAFQVINHTLHEVMKNASNGKLTFGILLTLWFASGGMTSMISGLNGAYEIRETRSWFKVHAIAFVLTLAISLLVIFALVTVLAGGYLTTVIGTYYGLGQFAIVGWKMAQWVVAAVFITFSFSMIYYFGPDVEEQHWYWITPGSIFGVLLWIAASSGFRAYLHFFNNYSRTYGSLGAVMILLIWLYVTGLSFLVGGEINAQIEHAAALRGHPEAKAPGEKKAA